MKIKEGFILTEVGDSTVAVPVGETSNDIKGFVRLNETGAFIWKGLSKEKSKEQIAKEMTEEYSGVDYDTALSCVEDIIEKLKADGMIED